MEAHHLHPKASLKRRFTPKQIDDIANIAFISAAANKSISKSSPAGYFPKVAVPDLQAQFIPLNAELRKTEQYEAFPAARRVLLADAMNGLLEGLRPAWCAPADETRHARIEAAAERNARDLSAVFNSLGSIEDATAWLDLRREVLCDDLGKLSAALDDVGSGGNSFSDSAARRDLFDKRRHVQAALEVLDAGRFGFCVSCEEPISWGRLEANNSAIRCLACASS